MDGFSLVDVPRGGTQNMAIDQALLELSARKQCVVLRVYQWSEPTLSLGYFQRLSDRDSQAESADLPVVRRATGGGAIVHHHEWTYAVAAPNDLLNSSVGPATSLYDCLHDAAVQWLNDCGLPAEKWSPGDDNECALPSSGQPFLCFQRRSCGDVVCHHQKILGSAQRRGRGAVLQHGSLLVSRSHHAPQLPGVAELMNGIDQEHQREFTERSFCSRLGNALSALVGGSLTELEALDPLIHAPVAEGKFADSTWTKRH